MNDDRVFALTDVETSGLDHTIHEVVEIGLVLFDPDTLRVIEVFDCKVKPAKPDVFDPRARDVNGYNEDDWLQAISLQKAIAVYGEMTKDAVFCAFNVTFDWGFINEAFKKTGVECHMHYHRFDIMSMAWILLEPEGLNKFSMRQVARHLNIPEEPKPHRAINGAMTEFEIFKALLLKSRRRI